MKVAVFCSFVVFISAIATVSPLASAVDIKEVASKDRKLKLELFVELSRHGERASKANYPHLVDGDSF